MRLLFLSVPLMPEVCDSGFAEAALGKSEPCRISVISFLGRTTSKRTVPFFTFGIFRCNSSNACRRKSLVQDIEFSTRTDLESQLWIIKGRSYSAFPPQLFFAQYSSVYINPLRSCIQLDDFFSVHCCTEYYQACVLDF